MARKRSDLIAVAVLLVLSLLAILKRLNALKGIVPQQRVHLGNTENRSSRSLDTNLPVVSAENFPPILHSSLFTPNHACKKNAIVYLAQKHHSTYGRNSLELLQQSLRKLDLNYLSINNHHENVNIFIFHEGDFDIQDIVDLEQHQQHKGLLHLVNLTATQYWQLPQSLHHDNTSHWKGAREYTIGYRHMMRWYALKIWQFFEDLNQQHKCHYEYIMRLDEESYIHSAIEYDLFDFMGTNQYEYAFRQCSYEMGAVSIAWANYSRANRHVVPLRPFLRQNLCGFYNNFFIAKLNVFMSPPVQHFLQFVDQGGYIYRQRTNDLVLQTAIVYAFVPANKIHRFLDFTYEHFTMKHRTGCPRWGGIQEGYNDPNGRDTVHKWAVENIYQKHCHLQDEGVDFKVREVEIGANDLSPTYQHLDESHPKITFKLLQVAAGLVDLEGKGIQSG